ncbi:type 4a pilus minor pilin PilE [Methylosoma difficile]
MFLNLYRSKGFTLIELLVAVAIVGILATIAIPAYQSSLLKARRGDAKAGLISLAQAQEKYRLTHTRYGNLADIGGAVVSDYYAFEVAGSDGASYEMTATPQSKGGQSEDVCGVLTITQTGIIIGSNASDCPIP